MGESCVEPTLARHPVGVARCGAASGRVFRGTLMVEPEQYRGDARLGVWFELAAAHNRTLEAKAPSEKPRAKKRASASGEAAGERQAGRQGERRRQGRGRSELRREWSSGRSRVARARRLCASDAIGEQHLRRRSLRQHSLRRLRRWRRRGRPPRWIVVGRDFNV